ncbi:uncharacterized protein V6R79_011538 [Siganus canaliculatus]
MSKKQRWQDALVNTKSNKPTLKTVGKELVASTISASNGEKQASSSASRTSLSCGRSSSLSSQGNDSTTSANKMVKRGSFSHQGVRQASCPARPSLRLSSSRSFSSLHTSSLTAAPFMRSSRSLNRLDQRSTRDGPGSQTRKGQTREEKGLNSGQLSSSVERIRDKKVQSHAESAVKMKATNSSEQLESSSSSTAECHYHGDKVKKQTRDGVYTLCAMTSGMRRNWIQAVLKNVRPSATSEVTSSHSRQTTPHTSQQLDSESTEEKCQHPSSFMQMQKNSDRDEGRLEEQTEQELSLQEQRDSSFIDGNSASSTSSTRPISSPTSALVPVRPLQQVEETTNNEQPNVLDGSSEQQVQPSVQHEEPREPVNMNSEQQTVQLVKELEQTQKELSRLQQLNKNLQDELQQERQRIDVQNDLLSTSSSSSEPLALKRLQEMNHDLRSELEAIKRSQEEAREAELRRRVDLLAQQAQLLVTGDATALAQAHLEQDRRHFQELQVEWEQSAASLRAQLSLSEEQRKEAELRLTQLQQELQNFHSLQQDADCLQKNLQEVKTQLQANEEAQAQKEARLQKHLLLLQASQDRERRSLAASLAQAEKHSQDLQERLDRAEQQVGSLNETRIWTREIEKAQQQLQEELASTVSTMQNLQEEREQLDRRCQELQNQLTEADGEVSRLQSRLKTEETHYYNLEHSYEKVSEEVQLALGKVQQRESETQEMREGYERLLDRKEQELSEVLLKMEVLGNSLEETEVKLNEVMRVCTCASSQLKDESSEPEALDGGKLSSYPSIVTAGDDPEKFMSVIQVLETKLYLTEEKLRDIMQRLDEHQSHITCQDPHLCSQLTLSRANAQHLSLMLHAQSKQSQMFAQETETRCRILLGRFQLALNIVEACRERIQTAPVDIKDFEKQLATIASCLQQGEKEALKQQWESRSACKGESKILHDETLAGAESSANDKNIPEDDMENVGKCLMKELFVVDQMLSAIQNQHGVGQLSSAPGEDEEDVAQRYKSIISKRLALKTGSKTHSERAGNYSSVIGRACAEAELIYAAFKCQQQYETMTKVNNHNKEHQKKSLADVNPPELAPYEEQVQAQDGGLEAAAKPAEKAGPGHVKAEKEPEWLERLVSRLQMRANFLRLLCLEISDSSGVDLSTDSNWESASAAALNWMQEQAKLIYLSERLHLDSEQELRRSEELQEKQDATIKDEREDFNQTLGKLQEEISTLREELQDAEEKIRSAETGNQQLLEDLRKIQDYHEERMKKLETEFQEKIRGLQQIHEEEMKHLHGYYTKSCKEKRSLMDETEAKTKDEPGNQMASWDEGFPVMEEMHRKLIENLQQQHQKQVAALLKEKDQLLQQETAATMAAIIAMRRAHKQELERSRQSQQVEQSADVTQLHTEHEREMKSLHKELELLSVQHTQKCLENSQLNQELQDERQSSVQYQKENEELKKKQREIDEMAPMNFLPNGKQAHAGPQLNDFYEMEVILRAREAEMQFLRQEARSLREELKMARMDKIYAQNKLEALYVNSQDEQHHDRNNVCNNLKFATWSSGRDAPGQSLEETVTNTNNSAFLKKTEKSSLTRQIRGLRSKSLKEGLSIQERMKLFESF